MKSTSVHNPIEEQHPSVEELQMYIAGQTDAYTSELIAKHLTDCDMCADIVEGLLEIDSQEGIASSNYRLYSDFKNKNLKKTKRTSSLPSLTGINSTNSLLLIIAALLLLMILASLFYIFSKPEQKEEDNTNRIDSLVAYNPSIVQEEQSTIYVPDSSAIDSSIQSMMHDPNVEYEYYDQDAPSTPRYNSHYSEQIYVNDRPSSTDITHYGYNNPLSNEGSTTPQNRYYGYNKNDKATKENYTQSLNTVQIGDQIIQVDNIVRKAQNYYNQGQYTEGIYFLDKYARNIKESIPDIDYWLARHYAANDQLDYAKYYLERLAGYQNPYTLRAKKMLGNN